MITQPDLIANPTIRLKLQKEGKLNQSDAEELLGVRRADIIIAVMEKFDMMIQRCSRDLKMYLVPCLMKPILEEKVSSKEDKSVPTLYFKFVHHDLKRKEDQGEEDQGAFLPHGLFHRLICRCLQRKKEWTMHKCRYDYMEFSTDKRVFGYLRMAYNSILLCAFKTEDKLETDDEKCKARSEVRKDIEDMLKAITKKTFPNLTYVSYLECMSKHQHRYGILFKEI